MSSANRTFSIDNEKEFEQILEMMKAKGKAGFQSETRLTRYVISSTKEEFRLKKIQP